MLEPGTVLDTIEKLATAMQNQLPVAVYNKGEFIHFVGRIQRLDNVAVKINDSYYPKDICEFRVR